MRKPVLSLLFDDDEDSDTTTDQETVNDVIVKNEHIYFEKVTITASERLKAKVSTPSRWVATWTFNGSGSCPQSMSTA